MCGFAQERRIKLRKCGLLSRFKTKFFLLLSSSFYSCLPFRPRRSKLCMRRKFVSILNSDLEISFWFPDPIETTHRFVDFERRTDKKYNTCNIFFSFEKTDYQKMGEPNPFGSEIWQWIYSLLPS